VSWQHFSHAQEIKKSMFTVAMAAANPCSHCSRIVSPVLPRELLSARCAFVGGFTCNVSFCWEKPGWIMVTFGIN